MAIEKAPTNHLSDTESRWFAVRTRSKSEKFAQRLLSRKGIHAWLPIQKIMRKYTRSTRMVEKPLINSYVFVKIVKSEYVPVLETENVAGFVKFAKNLLSIPEAEIEILRRVTLEHDLDLDVIPGSMEAGEHVEISAGNLMGMRGRVVQVESKRKVQIELTQLGYSLIISVDIAFLTTIGNKQ